MEREDVEHLVLLSLDHAEMHAFNTTLAYPPETAKYGEGVGSGKENRRVGELGELGELGEWAGVGEVERDGAERNPPFSAHGPCSRTHLLKNHHLY